MGTATMQDTPEVAVLYAILTDPACIADVADSLRAADFGVLDYGTIYGAMLACHSRGQRPDMVTVADELTARGDTRLADEVYHIPGSTDAWVSSVYVGDYAARVVRQSRRRSVVKHATDLLARLTNDADADPVELAHTALSHISDISDADDGPVLYADVIDRLQERLTLQVAGEWEERLFRTGFHDLDAKMGGGLRGGDLVYLAGRPGSGKTAMALDIAHNGARRNEPVLFFSGEMSVSSLVERGLSEVSGLSMDVIRKRVLPRDQYEQLMTATERMAHMPVAIDATAGIKTAQVLTRAQRFQRRHGLGAVFFDYVELAGDPGQEGETQRLSEVSHMLKRIAVSLDVPVIALSQLNRNVEQRNPPRPRMSDLRQSGALEQDADSVWLLYRQDYYQQQGFTGLDYDPTREGIAEIIVGKHRNGPTGTVDVRFDDATMRFQNLTRDEA